MKPIFNYRQCQKLLAIFVSICFMFYLILVQDLKSYLIDFSTPNTNRYYNFNNFTSTKYVITDNISAKEVNKKIPIVSKDCLNCNISQKLLECVGKDKLDMLSHFVLSNAYLLPLDVSIAGCVVDKKSANYQEIFSTTFGIVSNGDKAVRIGLPGCSRTNITDTCISFKCSPNIGNIRVIRLTDKDDYWLGNVDCSADNAVDTNYMMAVKKLHMQRVTVGNVSSILYPLDIVLFHKHLTYSKYVGCNTVAAAKFKKSFPKYFTKVTPKLNKTNLNWLVKLRDVLNAVRMTPMLSSGTLLGWYRECGIVPHTHDFDLMVKADEYNEYFEQLLLNHKHLRLVYRYNLIDDLLEYTIKDPTGAKTDIFFLYEDKSHSWYGGIGPKRTRLKYTLPKLEQICSTDFLGYLFHVPCNALQFILADFGKSWNVPVAHKDYYYYKSPTSVKIVKTLSSKEYRESYVKF